jgi:hydroxyethylthiazole kinase-like uncharacterized protein yjeF
MIYQIEPRDRPMGRRVLSIAEMRLADACAIADHQIPGFVLMDHAGRHLALRARDMMTSSSTCIVLAGKGNNGGDGYCAARHLMALGRRVEVWAASPLWSLADDAALAARTAVLAGVPVKEPGQWQLTDVVNAAANTVLVDALLGTGLKDLVRPEMAEIIDAINRAPSPVISADIPSGICGDTGRVLGTAIQATTTVTFQSSKLGHWLYPGAGYVGTLSIVDIGMPDSAVPTVAKLRRLASDRDLAPIFAHRTPNSHKGTHGHVLAIGGMLGRTGAIRLVADAAMVAGAGLVTVGTSRDALMSIAGQSYETMASALFDEAGDAQWTHISDGYDALVIGPGLPSDAHLGARLFEQLPLLKMPMVIDADGLNHLARQGAEAVELSNAVMTPHPGEAGRLLGCSTGEIQADRIRAVETLVARFDTTVVLKGAHSLIGTRNGNVIICGSGNPGMATAGTGDVLAGVIGALLARGLGPEPAAIGAVLWHAMAGDRSAIAQGPTGLRARDILVEMRGVEAWYRDLT